VGALRGVAGVVGPERGWTGENRSPQGSPQGTGGGEEPPRGGGGGAPPPLEGQVEGRTLLGEEGVALLWLRCHRCQGGALSGLGPCNGRRLWACRTQLSWPKTRRQDWWVARQGEAGRWHGKP